MDRQIAARTMDPTPRPEPAVESVALRACADLLAQAGVSGAYARHLLRHIPDAPVLRSTVDPRSVAICGLEHGRYEVSFTWILGEDPRATVGLVDALRGRPRVAIYIPAQHRAQVAERFAELTVADERVYALDRAPAHAERGGAVRLGPDNDLPVAPDLQELLPPRPIWDAIGFQFWGAMVDGVIASLAECTVDDGHYAAVQQVQTATAYRRRGLGRRLVAGVCQELREAGRTPLYVCDAANVASWSLAESVGFEQVLTLGCVMRRSGAAE